MTQIEYLFKQYIPLLPHANDGVIFTKNKDAPYYSGTNNDIVKWKPPHLNTIDFLLVPNKKLEDPILKNKIIDLYVML